MIYYYNFTLCTVLFIRIQLPALLSRVVVNSWLLLLLTNPLTHKIILSLIYFIFFSFLFFHRPRTYCLYHFRSTTTPTTEHSAWRHPSHPATTITTTHHHQDYLTLVNKRCGPFNVIGRYACRKFYYCTPFTVSFCLFGFDLPPPPWHGCSYRL